MENSLKILYKKPQGSFLYVPLWYANVRVNAHYTIWLYFGQWLNMGSCAPSCIHNHVDSLFALS
jgi:hypothetical protein